MIDGIKRRLGKSIGRDPWDADRELQPEEVGEASEPTDETILVPATLIEAKSNDLNTLDHYRSLVRTAIANDGRYADHQIPVPWLRMILAGLELRHIDPEKAWEGFAGAAPSNILVHTIPKYDDLFPSRRDGR
ncbi:MAG TPA: hypothetical protein VEB87_02735 [Nitrososphaerales archaeon]|nr:hypothetical protein [Nitrososphaerales archaeon]